MTSTVTTGRRTRPRILLLACGCSPDRGSEGGVGWNRAVECAKHFDTWVICQTYQNKEEVERYLRDYGPIPGLHFHFVPHKTWEGHLWSAPGMGYISYNLWHRRAFRVARRLHEQLRFDLVHQLNFCGFREPGYLWKLDAPFVWGPIGGTHNYPWRFLAEAGVRDGFVETLRSITNSLQLRFAPRVRMAADRAAALMAANSTGQAQFAAAHGITPTVMLEVGVSHVADAPARTEMRSGPLRILWCGELIPRKALSLLLRAIAQLPEEVRCEVRVLGRGPLERRWKRLANRLGVDKRVQWLGWVPHHEALKQYAWADVFAFTSLRDTTGTVVLEALSNGLPVVCLDHQGVHDVVTDECGVKVPVTDRRQVVVDLRDALVRLAQDPILRERLSHGALARARYYHWSQQGARMAEIYRRVLSDANSAAGGSPLLSTGEPAVGKALHTIQRLSRSGRILRKSLQGAMEWTAARTATGLNALFGPRPGETFGILMYHRVTDHFDGVATPTWNVTPAQMRRQLAGLIARGFVPWSLAKLLDALRDARPIPHGVFAVTFDDGYENNYSEAWPILRELQVPATIFLATAFLNSDRPFPFDDWSAAGSSRVPPSSWRPLSTRQCQDMLDDGLIDFGSHTHTHERFLGRQDEFDGDLARSLDVLSACFGVTKPVFAFPFGASSPELIAVAKKRGVTCSFSTRPARVFRGDDAYGWGRFQVNDGDSPALLAAKLSGWYTAADTARKAISHPIVAVARSAHRANDREVAHV
ncbi:MAG: glycosyltransferase [Planctomycetia bacterium]|nr:glycosyltransferase [Planctomycetia bacterium]